MSVSRFGVSVHHQCTAFIPQTPPKMGNLSTYQEHTSECRSGSYFFFCRHFMTLVSTTAGIGDSAKLLEKGTLSAKSRIQESKRAVIGEGGRSCLS